MVSVVRRPGVLASAAVALALSVAACGGSSSGGASSSSSGSTVTTSAAPSVAAGQKLFESVGCKSCHTLKAAGASGQVGPDLDNLRPTEAAVVKQVTNGGGGMPAFKDQLSSSQIQSVAEYVHSVAGH